jgi:hypothetical protein
VFVTNRLFRELKNFAEDLSADNTACFDGVAGHRLLAMAARLPCSAKMILCVLNPLQRIHKGQSLQNGEIFFLADNHEMDPLANLL